MSDIAIRCQGLGKRYRTGSRAPYHRFSELLSGLAGAPLRALGRRLAPRRASGGGAGGSGGGGHVAEQWFWALQDIDLEVRQGEVLGVIGRNGAGKSTLLKLLSRVTDPTAGRAEIFGRVGSLLEVGTGFHPELTGRENIFLNGAILGMTRAEVKARFDEIVAFAEVEMFLDTPVKRYSSGMQTRLGFAVAAHLEPEILIVDEVLAVGDAVFQRKCIGKMSDIAGSGRTVLFVSHNMISVERLCTRCAWLDGGRLVGMGAAGDLVRDYLGTAKPARDADLSARKDREGNGAYRMTSITVEGAQGQLPATGREAVVRCIVEREGPIRADPRFAVAFTFSHERFGPLFTCYSLTSPTPLSPSSRRVSIVCRIPQLPLLPDQYAVASFVSTGGDTADLVRNALAFEVTANPDAELSWQPTLSKNGPFSLPHHWELKPIPDFAHVSS